MEKQVIEGIEYLDLREHSDLLDTFDSWSGGPGCPVHGLADTGLLRVSDLERVETILDRAIIKLEEEEYILCDGTEDPAELGGLRRHLADLRALHKVLEAYLRDHPTRPVSAWDRWDRLPVGSLVASMDLETGEGYVEQRCFATGEAELRIDNPLRKAEQPYQAAVGGWFDTACLRVTDRGDLMFFVRLESGARSRSLVVRVWRDREGRVVMQTPEPLDDLLPLERVGPNRLRTLERGAYWGDEEPAREAPEPE